MLTIKKTTLALLITTILTGCGGSDSKPAISGSPVSEPTIQKTEVETTNLLESPVGASKDELKKATQDLITARYTGSNENAPLTDSLIKQAYNILFVSTVDSISSANFENINKYVKENGDIDGVASCNISGHIAFDGQLDEQGKGNIVVDYKNCQNYDYTPRLSGSVTAHLVAIVDGVDTSFYFNNVKSEDNTGQTQTITGYLATKTNKDKDYAGAGTDIEHNMLVEQADGVKYISSFTARSVSNFGYDDELTTNGFIKFSDKGEVKFNTNLLVGEAPKFSEGEIKFTGASQNVDLVFSKEHTAYYLDSNGDGKRNEGAYITNFPDTFSDILKPISTVAIDQMSLPPIVGSPLVTNQTTINTTTPITVVASDYSDPDSPSNELEVSFRWFLNDEIIDNQTSGTLPAGTAKFGDQLHVAVVVSDKANEVMGPLVSISIADAPVTIVTSNLPSEISSGDIIKFNVQLVDPDKPDEEKAASLISAPGEVQVDNNGQITWTAPNNSLFSPQDYYFTFNTQSETDEKNKPLEVKVTINSPSLPIARSTIAAPTSDNSIYVDDFDGDGDNEILTTDNQSRLMLLSHQDKGLEQVWLYPYALPTAGEVNHIFTFKANDQAPPSIYVLTQHGLSFIKDLQSEAKQLISFDKGVVSGAISDIDKNGEPEFAITLATEGASGPTELLVYSNLDFADAIFNTTLYDNLHVLFGNVDSDENIELVTSSGLVYDTKSWQNQWLNSGAFGNTSFTLGDLDNDGIEEIIAGNYSSLKVYSAEENTQIGELELSGICGTTVVNIDNDNSNELIVGDCQFGNVKVYDVENNSVFTELTSISSQERGTKSILIDDSDNDGDLEILWSSTPNFSRIKKVLTADIQNNSSPISVTKREDSLTTYLSGYTSAGWSTVGDVVFTSTNHLSQNVTVNMDILGKYNINEPYIDSSSNHSNNLAKISQFNNQGKDQAIISDLVSYKILDLETNTVSYENFLTYGSVVTKVDAIDVDGDNIPDAIYSEENTFKSSENTLNLFNVFNEQIIGSFTASERINDFSANNHNGFSVAIATDKLQVLELAQDGLSISSTYPISCMHIEYFNFDSDDNLEILCLGIGRFENNYEETLYVFEHIDNDLEIVHQSIAPTNVIDIVASPTKSTYQDIIFFRRAINSQYWGDIAKSQVLYSSAKGHKIWSSPNLIGSGKKEMLDVKVGDDGQLKMIIATSEAMYNLH